MYKLLSLLKENVLQFCYKIIKAKAVSSRKCNKAVTNGLTKFFRWGVKKLTMLTHIIKLKIYIKLL